MPRPLRFAGHPWVVHPDSTKTQQRINVALIQIGYGLASAKDLVVYNETSDFWKHIER
jgi:hypothetical protein